MIPTRILTEWSEEYVQAHFQSKSASGTLRGWFPSEELRDAYLKSVENLRGSGVEVRAIEKNDFNVVIGKATPETLMELVNRARSFDGEIQFPGALPALDT